MRSLLMAFACCVLSAQPAGKAKFDFVSIRQASQPDRGCGPRINSALQFNVHGCTLNGLIRESWGLRSWNLELSKDRWISSVAWDINAKSLSAADPGDHWQMMQSVLKERFALKVHHETRQVQVYSLKVSRGGEKLLVSKANNGCVPFDHKAPPIMPRPGEPDYCDYVSMPFTKDGLGAQIIGTQLSITSLLRPLTLLLGRPVFDGTELTGAYDVHLTFAKDSVAAFGLSAPGDPSGLPSIFSALRSVGLELVSGKGPVDVLVVDSVQKPSEN